MCLPQAEHPKAERPTLDVKKDTKGWVSVANATIREVPTLEAMARNPASPPALKPPTLKPHRPLKHRKPYEAP